MEIGVTVNVSRIPLRVVVPVSLAIGAVLVVVLVLLGQTDIAILLGVVALVLLQLVVLYLLRRTMHQSDSRQVVEALKGTETAIAGMASPPEHAMQLLTLQHAAREAQLAQQARLLQDGLEVQRAQVHEDLGTQRTYVKKEVAGIRRELERVLERSRLRSSVGQLRQIEAVLALYHDLEPTRSLPLSRPWAATPDLLHTLVGVVEEHRPSVALDIGSGKSTIILALAMQRHGGRRVVSLEHDPEYFQITRALVRAWDLEGFVDLRLAPIVDVSVGAQDWKWYDPDHLPGGPIDLVFVDGPPGALGPQSRYPAVPLLRDRLASNAIVVLDDYDREDEQAVVQRWQDEWPGFELHTEPDFKGTAILSLQPPDPA